MRETAVQFGSNSGLIGVLSEPAQRGETAVLLFNVGLNHHVGPHRLNVELARHLSQRGMPVLRFDLSGLGDSEARRDSLSDTQRAIVDVREAMDFLETRLTATSFVVIGLCSGVDPAHAVAVSDPRVRGAVFIDGYAYTTPGYYVRDLAERAGRFLDAGNYSRWFRRRILPLVGRREFVEQTETFAIFDRTFPPRSQFKADLDTMLGRGMQLFFLYTRNAYFFNYRAQFAEMIGSRSVPGGVEVDHQLGADHIFTSVLERARSVRRIGDWITVHFGAQPANVKAVS